MIYQQGVDLIARQSRLDPPARWLQETVRQLYKTWGAPGRRAASALHGTRLGHPFHPAATDVAIGAWTAATGLDLLGALAPGPLLARCADAALFIGLAGGVASAASGLTDWQHTSGQPRRVGLVHGLINLSAFALHETCTHLGGPLSQGALVDGAVQCPWHGSRFALDDGRVVDGPAAFPERCFATRLQNGQIEVGPGGLIGHCQHQPVTAPQAERAAAMAARR